MALHPSLIYSGEFIIRTFEIDGHRRCTAASLLKLMQEAAMQNVVDLGLSVWDLAAQNISWVVLRMDVDFFRLPMLGEKIRVVTYGSGFEKLFAYRDYRVYDEQNNLLAQASSTWLMMDVHTRKMARIPDYIMAFETPPREECLPRPLSRMPKWEEHTPQMERSFRVNWHELDFNRHLNNIYYMQWMLEVMDDAHLQNGTLRRMEIQFKNECQWKDEVTAMLVGIDDQTFLHRLLRQSDGQEMAIARTFWEV